mmetsp:Transcript_2793/g.4241  ORF Transcript_2793/g.4241 Transcript_2793/m.4241 type:complete len:104 (-) Transcript_2793:746-1057(-)
MSAYIITHPVCLKAMKLQGIRDQTKQRNTALNTTVKPPPSLKKDTHFYVYLLFFPLASLRCGWVGDRCQRLVVNFMFTSSPCCLHQQWDHLIGHRALLGVVGS